MKTDRRVTYTKKVLKESLLELIPEKPLNKISVKEICEKADVNRATFYSHFSDVFDMLNQIENDLYETIRSSIDKGGQTGGLIELLTEICVDIKRNEAICIAILSENGDKDFLNRVLLVAHDKCISEWKTVAPHADIGTLEKIYSFFSHGCAAVIISWAQNGMQESPEEIAAFIEQITNRGLSLLQDDMKKRR